MRKLPETLVMLALLLVAVWLAWQFAWWYQTDFQAGASPLQDQLSLQMRRDLEASPPALLADVRRLGSARPVFFLLAGLLPVIPLLGLVPPVRRAWGASRFAPAGLRRHSLLVLLLGVLWADRIWLGHSTFGMRLALLPSEIPPEAREGLAVLRLTFFLAFTGQAAALLFDGTRAARGSR